MSNLAKLLSRSNTLARQGDLAGARAELEKAVRDHPRSADPWVSLAGIHGMGGNFTESLRCAHKAVELAPHSLQAWSNLANAASATGDFRQAASALRRATTLPGAAPQLSLELGMMLAHAGNWAEAVTPLRDFCTRQPGQREATLMLASALARTGASEPAADLLDAYLRQYPQDARALTQQAYINFTASKLEAAWQYCNRAVAADPDDQKSLLLRASLLVHDARYEEAREQYEHIIRLQQQDPNPATYILAAKACRESGDYESAKAYARTALGLNPADIPALTTLGALLVNQVPVEARRLMEQAVALAPRDPAVLILKSTVLEFEGDKQGAWDAVQAVIENGVIDVVAAVVAASIAPDVGKTAEAVAIINMLLEDEQLAIGEQRKLHYALTRLHDKARQYDLAFEHARIANRLKNAWYDHAPHRVDLERLKVVYSGAGISALPRASNRSALPLFIVGMPRSGTSLMEQILSCHSQVHARGEAADIGRIVGKIPYYPDGVRSLTPQKLDHFAEPYLQHLRELDPSAQRFTDKLPGNYFNLGIISQLLPGARIINCRRDPRDVCLSQFMIEFGHGHTYTYDLESLAYVCRDYLEIQQHWKQVLPIPIMDVRYEELIGDPRAWVEKVLEFCGLEWEDACLNFHRSSRQVITASYDQVRKPLYKSSVARWKHYERQLEPISRILGLHDDSYY